MDQAPYANREGDHVTREEIRRRLATCKGPLVVSDDTQMTLFAIEGMARAKRVEDIVPEVREAYLDWLSTQGYRSERSLRSALAKVPEMRHPRAPGNACLSSPRSMTARVAAV